MKYKNSQKYFKRVLQYMFQIDKIYIYQCVNSLLFLFFLYLTSVNINEIIFYIENLEVNIDILRMLIIVDFDNCLVIFYI